LIGDEMPVIPIYFYMGVNFFDPDKIGGVYNNLLDEHPVWAIYRKDKPPQRQAKVEERGR
jgi:oligopeptide transport system substrate-binding protein